MMNAEGIPKELQTVPLELPPPLQRAESTPSTSNHNDVDSADRPVWIHVDDQRKVVEIGIREDWNKLLAADDFGKQLLEAYNSAMLAAAAASIAPVNLPKPTTEGLRQPVGLQPPDAIDLESWLAESKTELNQINEFLQQQRDGKLTPPPPEKRTIRSERGYLVLEMSNDTLVGVEANSDAIENAPHRWLHEDAWAAFNAAGLTVEDAMPAAAVSEVADHSDTLDHGRDHDFDDAWEGIQWE